MKHDTTLRNLVLNLGDQLDEHSATCLLRHEPTLAKNPRIVNDAPWSQS